MDTKLDLIINNIYEKLKKSKRQKIKLKKDEFKNFIFFLLNKS